MAAEFAELAGRDAYELLGVAPGASTAEIRRAHRRLVKQTHPDLFPDERSKAEAEARLRLLNAARTALVDRRAAYDAFRDEEAGDEPADAELIDDPWDSATQGAPPPDPWDASDPWDEPDPWDAADPDPPPAPPPPPGPVHRPMPPPPRYAYPPGPSYYAPPLQVRHRPSPAARGALGCAFAGIAFMMFVALVGFISNYSEDVETRPPVPVPERFAGTWSGRIKDKDEEGATWKAEFRLRAGWNYGRVEYLDGRCTGTAIPMSYEDGRLVVNTVFPEGKEECDVGDVQFDLREDGRLNAVYRDEKDKVESSGVLVRTQ